MKLLLRLLLLAVLVSIVGLVFSVFLIVQNEPMLASNSQITVQDVRRARAFMKSSDPRGLRSGEMSAFTISAEDLEVVVNYGLSRLLGGAAKIDMEEGRGTAAITMNLPENPLGAYLNISAEVSQLGDTLVIDALRVGGLTIPGKAADLVARRAHRELQRIPEYKAAVEAVNGFSIAPGRLNVVYQWQPELLDQLSSRGRELLVSAEDRERLLAHTRNLSELTRSGDLPATTSAAHLLAPMFQFAQARGGDPVAENQAVLLVAGMTILGINVPKALGVPADSIPPPRRRRLTLSGRRDFAQHFLVSAALTAGTGSVLADTIGLLKELDDSQGGSGFSFADIGADRTGVRFAELAIASPASARAVQSLLAAQPEETLFMADFKDLPEFMPEAEFIARFGGVDQPAYNAVLEEIESRIAATQFFSALGNRATSD
ncbi:MAG: hypothetical protein R3F50_11680 [Gammaproteobacteria bacterium]